VASAAALLASCVVVALWERAYDHPTDTGSPFDLNAVRPFLDGGDSLVRSAIGTFGWLDVPLPWWIWVPWLVLVLGLCAAALVVGSGSQRLILAVGLLATVAVTYASYAAVFLPVGAWSKGRHLLPLLAFCPTFAGVVVVRRLLAGGHTTIVRWTLAAVRAFVAVGHYVALYTNGRRYAVGLDGPVDFIGEAAWSPPGGWVLWFAVGAVAAAGLAIVAARSRPDSADHIASAGDT
jgi:Predicted membrane protein (DUF2142)